MLRGDHFLSSHPIQWTSLGILAGYYVESDIYEKLGVQVTCTTGYAVLTGQSGLTLYVASSVVFKCLATYFRVYRRPLEVVNIGLTWEAQPKDRQTCREDSHNRTFRGHMRVCSDTTECFGVCMKCLKTSVLVEYLQHVLGKCMLSYIVCVNKRL